jgi:hypothetical protein
MLVKTTVGDRSLSWLKGQLGLVNWDMGLRRQPRGQIYFQGNTTSETITETYTKVDNTTTLDGSALYFESPSNNGRLTYVGSQARFFNVIATLDVTNTTGASVQVSIKLAKNGSVIDATQCNATVPDNGVGKLHSMWVLELEKDDYVEVFLATATGEGSKSLIPVRMRIQITCLS